MRWLVFLFCYLAFANGTLLLPLLLYNLIKPRQPVTTPKTVPSRYDFVKIYDHFDPHAHDDDHGHDEENHNHHGDHGKHDDHVLEHHHYKVVKLGPPKIKVIPGVIKISDPVVKVKVKLTKDKDYDDHTDKYDY